MTGRGFTFEEALEVQVTREQARAEIERHSAEWTEFIAEMGDRETYGGAEVLAWLGY